MLTSRLSYIGCNSPSQLQYLNIRKAKNYSSIPISHYPFLKKLNLRLSEFSKLSFIATGDGYLLKHLNELTLDATDTVRHNESRFPRCNIDTFINCQSLFDSNKIKQLNLIYFEFCFGTRNWEKLFSKFRKITHLSMIDCYLHLPSARHVKELRQMLTNLIGLQVVGHNGNAYRCIQAVQSQLQFASIQQKLVRMRAGLFPRVVHLELENPTVETLTAILPTATALSLLVFSIRKNSDIAPAMHVLISHACSLQLLKIQARDQQSNLNIFDGIKQALHPAAIQNSKLKSFGVLVNL